MTETEERGTMISHEPAERSPGRRAGARPLLLRHERDREQRQLAARLGEAFPHWVVLWGTWSRQYWAFPQFRAPRGTIIHSPGPADLAAQMRQVQAMVASQRPVTP